MQKMSKNKAAVKGSVLVTTFIALSVWAGSLLLAPEKRTSVPIVTSTTTPTKPATSLDSNAKVFVSIEGMPIDEKHPLGGEGLILPQPITRSQFNANFSIAP